MSDEKYEEPSAFGRHAGMEMTGWRQDYARVEIALDARHGNRHGLPHGGVHATLIDTAMGYAGCWSADPEVQINALTLTLNVQYLSRPEGTRLIAEGRRTGGGRSTFFAEAEIRDETGHLIARGTGVFRYRTG